MKDALVSLLQGITYDAGGGAEPAFANVTDNNVGAFEGDPNVQVLPGALTVDLPTTGQADKTPAYIIRLRVPMEDNNISQSTAFNQMYDLTDLIIDAITQADHDGTLVTAVGALPGINMLNVTATRGDWIDMTSFGGAELICDVNVENYYSRDLQ